MTVIQVSMTETMLDTIDAMAKREQGTDERKPNRSRTIRRLIRKGIEAEETGVR